MGQRDALFCSGEACRWRLLALSHLNKIVLTGQVRADGARVKTP